MRRILEKVLETVLERVLRKVLINAAAALKLLAVKSRAPLIHAASQTNKLVEAQIPCRTPS